MADGSVAATKRFTAKREAIVAAATEILNQRGVRGMTLAGVAAEVGLITTSVTYYFKKKDELAAACFASGIARLMALTEVARQEPTPTARVSRLLQLCVEMRARISGGAEPALPVFSDIRALSPGTHGAAALAYRNLFHAVRRLLTDPETPWMGRAQATARTQILLEQIHWMEVWLARYEVADYSRACERMCDILLRGLAVERDVWRPAPLKLGDARPTAPAELFLLAATRLINERGYRGASVELISASLNVTKGSFYHHHNAKDDVVSTCFERSFDVIRRAQLAARDLAGDEWVRLTSSAAALVEFQFSGAGPLLRTSALAALPETLRDEQLAASARISDRFAAMISDGIAQGSIRPVDPFIAAQMLSATLNAAADLPVILHGVRPHTAVELYARPMFMGLTAQ
ncbi:MAG TPA: TetR family transcriptional regulator [Caulobacteraceae bacterium]|jgi:AcrR family transcriptional regulator